MTADQPPGRALPYHGRTSIRPVQRGTDPIDDPAAYVLGADCHSEGEVTEIEVEAGDATEGPSSSGWRRWGRPVAAWVLAVLAALAIAVSILAVWVHETVLDTDAFMAVVSPAVESEAVQAATADYLATELLAALDVPQRVETVISGVDDRLSEGLAEALDLTPSQAALLGRVDIGLDRLAAPIAAGIESRIRGAVETVIDDPRTTDLLLQLTEVAHERIVLLLRDETEQLPNVVISDGEVRLNMVPLIGAVLRSVIERGTDVLGIDGDALPDFSASDEPGPARERLAEALGARLGPEFGQVEIMSEQQLRELQGMIVTLDRVVWALIIAAILLSLGAVLTAPSIGSGVFRVAIGGGLGLLLGLLLVNVVSSELTEAVASPTGRRAMEEVLATLVASLQPALITLAAIGFVAAAVAYVAGRTRTA